MFVGDFGVGWFWMHVLKTWERWGKEGVAILGFGSRKGYGRLLIEIACEEWQLTGGSWVGSGSKSELTSGDQPHRAGTR